MTNDKWQMPDAKFGGARLPERHKTARREISCVTPQRLVGLHAAEPRPSVLPWLPMLSLGHGSEPPMSILIRRVKTVQPSVQRLGSSQA